MIVTPSQPSAPLTRPAISCAVCAQAARSAGIGGVDVVGVCARDHEDVAAGGREEVEESDGALVLVDALRRHSAGGDAAEDAVAHGSEGYGATGRGTGSAESVWIAIASGAITHAATAQAMNAFDGSPS